MIGDCPQGYNGLRNWAKQVGLSDPKTAAAKVSSVKPPNNQQWRPMAKWPFCNPCKENQECFEFKPGVAKCIEPAAKGQQYLKEGDLCLDFSNGAKKWTPKDYNSKLYGKSCQWPFFSCNWDPSTNNGRYTCQRIRDANMQPVVQCYRAAGGRWWGGSDQWYSWNNGKFTPCGGPNPDYKKCEQFPACANYKPWNWAE
eukprot:gene9403-9567_t